MYLPLSAAILLFLGVIWTKSSVGNIVIKVILIGTSFWGVLSAMHQFGYVVRL